MARKPSPFKSPTKARKVLSEETPTLGGKPITPAQRRALGAVAGGEKLTRLKKTDKF